MSENDTSSPLSPDDLLSLSFAPDWARSGSSESRTVQQFRTREDRPRFDKSDDRRPRPFRRDGGASDRPKKTFSDNLDRKPNRFNDQPVGRFDDRGPSHFRRQEEIPELPLELRVLPEQKALGAMMRRIQGSHKAYPLRDLAALFLDNPNSCHVKAESLKGDGIALFQCRICGLPAMVEDEIRQHVVNAHMDDFFDSETVECDPPAGVFNCVARCGLSGEWIGPPNHHSFNLRLHELMREKFPNMGEEQFRTKIEMLRDSESIEAWRASCKTKKIYRLKTAEVKTDAETGEVVKAPAIERDAAELLFKREILPAQVNAVKGFVCSAAVALKTPSRPLQLVLQNLLQRERRFPASLFFALRGAFRHRKFSIFRAQEEKGPEFVTFQAVVPLDSEHAVQTLKDAVAYVGAHSCCTRHELLNALTQGAEEAKVQEAVQQVAWLLEKGHVIEYYNGLLALPAKHPAFKLTQAELDARRDGGRPRPAAQEHRQPVPAEVPAPAASEPEVAEPAAETVEPAVSEPVAEAPAVEQTDAPAIPEQPVAAEKAAE